MAGDRAALAEIYDAFAGRVYRFALLHAREPADAEDLLQRLGLSQPRRAAHRHTVAPGVSKHLTLDALAPATATVRRTR